MLQGLNKVTFLFALIVLVACIPLVNAQTTDTDYLPQGQNYDPKIPLPADVLGYPVGTWHVRHDQLVQYMRVLAEKSDRITIVETGRTHEHRPLVLLTITAPKNHQDISQIKAQHIERLAKGETAKSTDPLIIYMGYSVHGNEPSGSNASLLVAYHLAASTSPEVTKLLNENVVLLDPSLNPDGLSRFAQWANMHKGQNVVSDPSHREHQEPWPNGRTNHYWFDLNRDWLLLTHPESKARIKQFHAWRPHILTDFHEMGTNSTFFFQPGIPSRKNPWTPEENVTLTGALAQFHAKALDANKQLYFSEESFDDFYYGKGSTYPDAHGSIGILFEQASSRGHAQESINGVVTFPASIQNQVTTSLSTFTGALANKAAIMAYQKQFYRDTKKLIKDDDTAGYLVAQGKDTSRFERMISILASHKIDLKRVQKDVEVNDRNYKANKSIYVSLSQPQYRLIQSLFSERKSFADNTFYDVSNWNIGLAFNFDYAPIKSSVSRKLSLGEWQNASAEAVALKSEAYAYAFEWFDHQAPKLLQTLLSNGLNVRVAGASFTAKTASGNIDFAPGTVLIPAALDQPKNWIEQIEMLATPMNIQVHSITSGLSVTGIDLGSRKFAPVDKPEVLIVGGAGSSSYETGEIWHYLDTQIGLPATIWDMTELNKRSIQRYSHIIFASGKYSSVSDNAVIKITEWIKDGGVLLGQKSALTWFAQNDWINNKPITSKAIDAEFSTEGMQYGDQAALDAKKLVAGAVFESEIDLTHPLFFGYERSKLPLFKTNNSVLQATDNPFEDIALYTETPLMAGYAAQEIQELVKNSAAIVAVKHEKGVVIGFMDNIHFRGYWDGTNKLTANALYMSPLL